MALKVAINGFGRIGRLVFKALQNDKDVDIVAINDLTDTKTLVHLLKYDSVHGKYPVPVKAEGDYLVAGNRKVKVLAEKDPSKLPWKAMKVDAVVESTGVFRNKEKLSMNITAAAKKDQNAINGRIGQGSRKRHLPKHQKLFRD